MKVEFCKLKNGEGLSLPQYQTAGAAGMDICAAVEDSVVLQPGEIVLIPAGFAMAIPDGFEAQIRPRSGLAVKHGITLINSPGTIDSDYRGEIKIPLINHGCEPFTLWRGDRIAQMVLASVVRVEVVEVSELDNTDRGTDGFGHTGMGSGGE
ncbi:dUTP diphosphatase [Desulforhopalus vacuolatus]|uniref:dUTP diphosphatase n=1 Tax=Desulforhopalus vacuolatus TaxID=40414 RepID=UPI001965FCF5|nr:dUTP diphosphatase [Desulforhopalus vacuolatus]MBM9519982.1 dUTP diphosphatase [Desulforhopalus vacuolatus]